VVIHASQDWSRNAVDLDPDVVADELWDEASHVLGLPPARPNRKSAHLWRHGLVDQSLGETYIFSSQLKIGAAGDWCLGRLAEHAYESGFGLAKAIINAID
jgi:hypothetical protein